MKRDKPLVSIIMPTYNTEKYIAEAIQSVLVQTYKNFELIIIDDGSNDSTKEIIYSFDDKRIKYTYQENQGVSVARNRGIELSKGEYITFLDADDAIPQVSIEMRVDYLDNYSNVDVIHGKVSIRNENLKYEIKSYEPFIFQDILRKTLQLNNKMFFNPGYMIRKSKLNDIKFQEGMTHAEDILFLLKLSSKNIIFGSIPYITYYYRVTGVSAMSNMIGWRRGYFDLLFNIKNINSISYLDTLIMRMKIARMLTSWHIKNRNIFGLIDIFKIFK